jgi:hypothetical protein
VLHAAVAHVQTTLTTDGSFGSPITTGSITLTATNLLVAHVMCWDGAAGCSDVASITLSGGGGSFTFAKRQFDGNSQGRVEQWYLANVPAGAKTADMAWSGGGGYVAIYLTEASGIATTSPLDGTCVSASGNSTSPASGNVSGAASSFYMGGVAAVTESTSFTAGTSKTIPTNGSTLSTMASAVEYYANPGSTPQNMNYTLGAGSQWGAIGCAYKVPVAGGPAVGRLNLLGVGQ